MNWATRLDRAVALARYHRPQQFFYRALRIVQRRLPSRSLHRSLDRLGPARITDEAEGVLQRMAERRLQLWPARHDAEWLQNMSRGEFRFLNQSATLAEQAAMPRLWRFHLQSQESLLELAEHVGAEHAWRLVADWLAEYPCPARDADAWHPFCISRRLPVWLMLAARHGVPDLIEQNFWTGVHRQAVWLSRNLEWDLGGNHLMENLRTLFVAKAVLEPNVAELAESFGGMENVAELAESFGQNVPSPNVLPISATEGSAGEDVAELAESFGGSDQSPKVLATSATNRLCDFRYDSRWLERQLDEQILPTGEHYERTPTYHALILLSLLEIEDVLPLIAARDQQVQVLADPLREAIAKMQSFLGSILHPDGMIPLFGDSVIDETPMPAVLITPSSALVSGTALAAGLTSGERRDASGETGTTTNDTSAANELSGTALAAGLASGERRDARDESEATTNDTNSANGLSGTALAAGPDAGVTEHVRPSASAYGSRANDYWVDRSPNTSSTRKRVGPSTRNQLGPLNTGLNREQTDPAASCLIFDHGPLACDHLPAHGHADLLAFEASWGGRRLIVDRGTFDYEDSADRQACRGTSGHNTLQIDEIDHADIWSRFRMGRRGRVVDVQKGSGADTSWCLASHDAYARIGVPRVIRLIVSRRAADAGDPAWLILDVAEATGGHEYRSPLHLHPDWDVVAAELPGSWLCRPSASPSLSPSQPEGNKTDQSVRVTAIADQPGFGEQVRLEESFYAPNFGERIENVAITRRWKAEGMTWSGLLIGPQHAKTVPAITVSRNIIRVAWAGWIREWVRNHE